MCIYIYIYVYIYIYTHICMCIYMCMHVCVCMFLRNFSRRSITAISTTNERPSTRSENRRQNTCR